MINEIKIVVSDHANMRLRERSGLNKKSCQRIAEKAFNSGVKTNDAAGQLKSYMINTSKKHHNNGVPVLYGDKLFIFAKEKNAVVLVTVLQIPSELNKKIYSYKKKANIA